MPVDTPDCTNTTDYKKSTLFLNSAASLTLLQQEAVYKLAKVQELAKILGTPNGSPMRTRKTIELLLAKWAPKTRKGYTVPNIINILFSINKLCDVDCTVFFHRHGTKINYADKIIGRGWRD